MAADNSRTPEEVRLELESERERLAQAVDSLRSEVDVASNIAARIRDNVPAVAAGAAGLGFFLAGGIGATMRLLARRSREGKEVLRFGPFSFVQRD